jgi:hypothetical protein
MRSAKSDCETGPRAYILSHFRLRSFRYLHVNLPLKTQSALRCTYHLSACLSTRRDVTSALDSAVSIVAQRRARASWAHHLASPRSDGVLLPSSLDRRQDCLPVRGFASLGALSTIPKRRCADRRHSTRTKAWLSSRLLGDQGNNSSGAISVVYFAKNYHVVPKKDHFNISSKEHASGM